MPAIRASLVSRALLLTAGVNALAGLASLAAPRLHARLLLAPGAQLDGLTGRYHAMVWFFVLAMAPGYALAAGDPARQSGLLAAGGVGKLGIALLWTWMWFQGEGSALMWGGILFDGTLGLLFLGFLLQNRAGAAGRPAE